MAKTKTNTSSRTTGGSTTSTTGGSSSVTNTHSQTTGGSTSVTNTTRNYGSKSVTNGGGSSRTTTTTAATGKVAPNTQANLDKYSNAYTPSAQLDASRRNLQANSKYTPSGDVTAARGAVDAFGNYSPSSNVQTAYQNLQNTLANKPASFSSEYETQMNDLYQKIMNRPSFHYNMNADALYQQYKDQYMRGGKSAMNDTLASANAQTGGYSSSYSQAAAQQQYQNYLSELNNIVPQLQQNAFSQYQYEGNQLQQNFENAGSLYSRDYNKWRASVSDWQSDRNFALQNYQGERQQDYNEFSGNRNYALSKYQALANMDWNQFASNREFYQNQYNSDRNFEYQDYVNNRNYWNQEYWNERNAEKTSTSNTDTTNWSRTDTSGWDNTTSRTDERNWSNTDTTSSTNTRSWQNSNTSSWSNTNSSSVADAAAKAYNSYKSAKNASGTGKIYRMGMMNANKPGGSDKLMKNGGDIWYRSH